MAIEPTTALYIGSALMRGLMLNRAGRIARQQAALEARRIKEQAKFRQLQAIQEHNQIMESLETFMDTNTALQGIMGRSNDRSLNAIRKKAEKNAQIASGRTRLQNLADQAKFASQAQTRLLQGKNQQAMYKMNTISTFISAAYGVSRLESGTPTVDPRYDMGKVT
tara:strand:- start:472 stop:969 length:498 start_codon:yes stop_codon:yes gene_type:complete